MFTQHARSNTREASCDAVRVDGDVADAPPRRFDLAVLPPPDEWPSGQRARQRWLSSIAHGLTAEGEILFVAPNRFGSRQLRQLLHGRGAGAAMSIRGYRHVLRRAGFQHIELYGLTRDRSGLVLSAQPLSPPTNGWSPIPPNNWKDRIKRRLNLDSELLIRAARRAPAPSVIDHILETIDQQGIIEGATARIRRLFTTAKGKAFLLLASGDDKWIVRIPLTANAAAATQDYCENLAHIRATSGPLDWLPEVCGGGDVRDFHFLVETAIHGRALPQTLEHQGLGQYLPQLIEKLQQLTPDPPLAQRQQLDGEIYDELVTTPLLRVLRFVPDRTLHDRVAHYFDRQLRGLHFTPTTTHGDFGVRNIFVEHGRISGVIDWDDARRNSIGVLDGINHLISAELYRSSKQNYAQTLFRLAYNDWPVAEERAFLDSLYHAMQVLYKHHAGLVYLYWLQATDTRLQDTDNLADDIVERYVTDVLDALAKAGKL
ncbi:MAG: phosphotransferase [Gammaproteobacteria bacterium]|nr:phosphotransferase [Gammaproteobacteria bacterium]